MKKGILTALMIAMLSTPCLAGVEPEGLFSIEGTYWRSSVVLEGVPIALNVGNYGYYDGKMYACIDVLGCYDLSIFCPACSYTDVVLVTFVNATLTNLLIGDFIFTGYLFPLIGLGVGFGYYYIAGYSGGIVITFAKITDNWTPPEIE